MELTRRSALKTFVTAASSAAWEQAATAQEASAVSLQFLGGAPPPSPAGISWGVPWARGTVSKTQAFSLVTAQGRPLPLQSWPLAYWPDGSVKWMGFATVAGPDAAAPLRLAFGSPSVASPLEVSDTAEAVEIKTARHQTRLAKRGTDLIESITCGGNVVARQGRLVCLLSDGASFTSTIRNVTLEQTGPVRAVVKFEGVHRQETGAREWLPFVVRLYFYSEASAIRLHHTIIFDGDEQRDFIRGLGLQFTIPMRQQVHNRHVRFAGEEGGLWSEPVQPLTGRRVLTLPGRPGSIYAEQLAGRPIPDKEEFNRAGRKLMSDWAVWDDFKLIQLNADGFTIRKRTNPQSCWLDAIGGRRSAGLVFAGDVSGGLGAGVKNFWQSHPASLEVLGAAQPQATLKVWLWSPDGPVMDLRHYDTRAHDLDSSYEDVQPGFSTPHGIARTSELTLFPTDAVPPKEEAAHHARLAQEPPLLLAAPEYIHSTKVFGIWSLPDTTTPAKRAFEEQLERAFEIYHREVEQRRWYGFWNYGDIMHQHDGPRHEWRYDVGGFAWDNTELGSVMWLWYTFLRTGRSDAFRMAEAMTRHTSEVDVYHLGRFAMLGSRHNVSHWGCGAKEARISQAAYHRFHYYLTTDERTGDVMREVVNADYKVKEIDPMRLAAPLTKPLPYPARVRGGPDWLAFVGNWMTEWERTGDTRWRDKIIAGMDSIAQMPFGFLTGPDQLYGYDPATGKLYALEERVGAYNLATIMGGAEVVFELNELIDHPGWKKAWNQYCRLHTAPQSVIAQDLLDGGKQGEDGRYARPGRLSAYLYAETKNPAFARKAWAGVRASSYTLRTVKPPEVIAPVEEVLGLSTNSVAQQSLELIEILELCGDAIG